MAITNKKELLAALSPWIPSMVGEKGEERASTLFSDIDSDRAADINKEVIDNLKEEFNKHSPIGITPQEFIRIAARNIDLNTQVELLHFMFQVGLMWETTVNRIDELLKRQKPPEPPNIGEN
jgi:hypothetical protein